jgi:hypothetical protein
MIARRMAGISLLAEVRLWGKLQCSFMATGKEVETVKKLDGRKGNIGDKGTGERMAEGELSVAKHAVTATKVFAKLETYSLQ